MATAIKGDIQEEIQRIKQVLVEKYKPQKIILFGSAARGEFDPQKSDLDFFVIKNDKRNIHDRMVTLYRLVKKQTPADFLVYTPQELQTRVKLGDPFILSIIEEGKVLYG